MRDFRHAKAMARTLRASLAARGLKITISQSLEIIAEAFAWPTGIPLGHDPGGAGSSTQQRRPA
jgi:hypothetical protein